MKSWLSPIENNGFAVALCYVIMLLAGPFLWLATHSAAAAAIVLAAAGVLAARGSRLRFHAGQAAMVYIFSILALKLLWPLFLGGTGDRFLDGNYVTVIISLLTLLVVGGAMVLAFAVTFIYVAVKAGNGHDVRLPGVGNLAAWLAQEQFTLKGHWPHGLALAVTIGAIAYYALAPVPPPPPPPAPVEAEVATVVMTERFAGFPWGIDVQETKKLAGERGWKTGDHPSPMYGLPCRGVFAGYPAQLQLFFAPDYAAEPFRQAFHQGFITIREQDAPVETLYRLFHDKLTAKYGEVPERGYEPWRMEGSKPYGPGYGSRWEITDENGQKFRIYLALELGKPETATAPAQPAKLSVRYENLTFHEKLTQANQRHWEDKRGQQAGGAGH